MKLSRNNDATVLSFSAVFLLIFSLLFFNTALLAQPGQVKSLSIKRNHSEMLDTQSAIVTVALGNPSIADTLIVSPNRLLINGTGSGATSLTLILENGAVERYQVQVTQNLTILSNYLKQLNPNIELIGDPNGNSVILMGTVPTRRIIDKAVEATVRFLGTSTISVSTAEIAGPTTTTINRAPTAEGSISTEDIENGVDVANLPLQSYEYQTHRPTTPRGFTETIRSGSTRVINLLVPEGALEPGSTRLSKLLKTVDSRIDVQDINGTYYLRGNVKTPASLIRALTLANSFTGSGALNYEVISDQGGVLLKTTDDGNNRNSNTSGNIERNLDLDDRLPVRGNIRQNIARGDVISVANGRVISLIHVEVNPRVEVKMRVVAIDREKTDELGVNWEITNNRFAIANFTGSLIDDLLPFGTGIDLGSNNLGVAYDGGSIQVATAIKALETNGAARTLSEPLLTVLSGETANYLVGGQVPIRTTSTAFSSSQNNSTTAVNESIEYRDFGIILHLRPTVLENGRIAISLDQNITEPDFTNNTIFGGVPLPSFNERSIQTFTEAGDGETWAVAGLLSYEDRKNVQGVPWLSDIPILGELFKVSSKNKKREELVITVTARTVTPLDSYAGVGEFPATQQNTTRDNDLLNSPMDTSNSLLLPENNASSQSPGLLSRINQVVQGNTPYHLPDQKPEDDQKEGFWDNFLDPSTKKNKKSYKKNRPFGL